MDWLKIALLLLQVANSFVTWVREKRLLQAGEDAAVAKASLQVLRQTDTGKKLMERIDALPDSNLDDLADRLGR